MIRTKAAEAGRDEELLAALALNESLAQVPHEELQCLIALGELRSYEAGEFLFKKGEPTDYFLYVLGGKAKVYFADGEEMREVWLLLPGEISGVLPYSRMKRAQAFGEAVEPTELLTLHRDAFQGLIQNCPALTEALVHVMASRIRTFTAERMQNEKLMSLGKLSAGLAHELNNPASAMVRSAEALKKHLRLQPEGFKRVMDAQLSGSAVDALNEWLFARLGAEPPELKLSERNNREEELVMTLQQAGASDAYELAEELVEYSVNPADLEQVQHISGGRAFNAVMHWLVSNLNTERMVQEIATSAARIAELIQSIKEYSHMDEGRDRELVDINKGITGTLTMMQHKARQNAVEIRTSLADNLPGVSGFSGELKQVWTNIIDNALDAMEGGGMLEISTRWEAPLVLVTFTDSGPGIPEAVQSQIFDPFFTTKPVGKGTGLGLDIVARIVRKHKADIDVSSVPGKTQFRISFPMLKQ